MSFTLIFRFVVFLLLLGAGYILAKRIKKNRIGLSLVGVLVLFIFFGFLLLSKKMFALAGFSLYLLLIILGFGIGILAGLGDHKKK